MATQSRSRDNELSLLQLQLQELQLTVTSLQRSMHILKSWLVFVILGISVLSLYKRLRKMCREEADWKRQRVISHLQKQVAVLQDQVNFLTERTAHLQKEYSPIGLSLSRQQSERRSDSGEKESGKKRSKRGRATLSRSKSWLN